MGRCDYQCSSSLFFSEQCTGNNQDLVCCTESEACDLISADTLTCTDLPYLGTDGNARTYVCCGGSDNSNEDDAGKDTGGDTTDDGNTGSDNSNTDDSDKGSDTSGGI